MNSPSGICMYFNNQNKLLLDLLKLCWQILPLTVFIMLKR